MFMDSQTMLDVFHQGDTKFNVDGLYGPAIVLFSVHCAGKR